MHLANIAVDLGATSIVTGLFLCLRFYRSISASVQSAVNRNIGVVLISVGAVLVLLSAVI